MDEVLQAEWHRHEPGWSKAYPLWCGVLRDHHAQRGAEVGVAFGGHSEAMLESAKLEKLYSVDMFRHDPSYDDPLNFSQERFDALFDFVKLRLGKFASRCELVRLESAEAARSVPDELDFVYIDANHSFEGAFRDLGLWTRKVRDGGLLGGHDYGHPDFPGVRKAVDEFCRRFGWAVHEEGEGVWWVIKTPLPISYVIPAYNCAGTIGEAVDSIRDGNLDPGDEIILVDDASTDNTGPMLTEMERAIPNIRMLTHRINKGTAAAARNTAIEAAAHSLIFCLDSDNVLASRSVQNLRDHLVSTGADAAAFGEIHYFRDKVANVTHQWRYRDNVHLADALAGSAWPGPSGNYLFTRESWLRAGRYYEPSLENRSLDSWAFGIRQLCTGSRMVSLPGTWYFHRYGHDSHYILNWQKGNQSLAALMVLVPFLDQLDPRDVDYLFSREGRYTWYSRLAERPIHVLSREAGRDGEVHLSGRYRLSEVRRTAKFMLNKIRSRIGRKDPRRQVRQ